MASKKAPKPAPTARALVVGEMVTYPVRFTVAQFKAISKEAKSTKTPIAQVVREAVCGMLGCANPIVKRGKRPQ